MRRLFLLGLVVAACSPGASGASGPRFEITNPGTGAPNVLPLLPLEVGGVDTILDGAYPAVIDGVIDDSDDGPIYRAVDVNNGYVQYYLETADGVFAAGNSDSGRLAHPVLFVPATVRAGMTWKVYDDDGALLFDFAVSQVPSADGTATYWEITGTPGGLGPDGETLTPNRQDYLEGKGFALSSTRLTFLDPQPTAKLPRRPVAMTETKSDLFGSAGVLSMVRLPNGHAIMTSGDGFGGEGISAPSLCLTTDGVTYDFGTVVNSAPFTTTTQLACLHAAVADANEDGVPVSQSVATEQGGSAFVDADGTVSYFPLSPAGTPILADKDDVLIGGSGVTGLFFLPGLNDGDAPRVVLNGCFGACVDTVRAYMTPIPFDRLFTSTPEVVPLLVPWRFLGALEQIIAIRDDEGGTSLLLRTGDGMLWSSTVDGPPHPGARLPGRLSIQAMVGGNEVLRVVGDGAVDRLHVSHGELSVEHIADVAMPPGELAENAFVWHDPAGDHLLMFATLYDDFELGAHGRFLRSVNVLPAGDGPMLTLTPAMKLQQQSLGEGDFEICGPGSDAATDAWTVAGAPTVAIPLSGQPCAVIATSGVTGELAGSVSGVGHVLSQLPSLAVNGLTPAIVFVSADKELLATLQSGEVAALPGDTFVGRGHRLGPGGVPADPPVTVAITAGVADHAGNGLWVVDPAGVVLIGASTETKIADSYALFPMLAVVGGGVVVGPKASDGRVTPTKRIAPDGTVTALPALDADHHLLTVLADGTACGWTPNPEGSAVVDAFFCLPPSGVERRMDYPSDPRISSPPFTYVALSDGRAFLNPVLGYSSQPYIVDPIAMTVTPLATGATMKGPFSYAADGSVWTFATVADPINGTLAVAGQLDATGFRPVAVDPKSRAWQTIVAGEHVFLVSDSSYGGSVARFGRR